MNIYDDWGTYMLVFNNSMEPFDNPKLRQAIARAIDKEALLSIPMFILVGAVMKETKGQANPKLVNELLRKKLS